jgi:hypothetical protein
MKSRLWNGPHWPARQPARQDRGPVGLGCLWQALERAVLACQPPGCAGRAQPRAGRSGRDRLNSEQGSHAVRSLSSVQRMQHKRGKVRTMSESMRIITNHVPRDLIDASQLTLEEQKEFDYLDWEALEKGEDSASFFRYKGMLYDLGNFLRTDISGWDGYSADSFFSGILVKYTDDNEGIIVGMYMC